MSSRGYNVSVIEEDKRSKELFNIEDIVDRKSFISIPPHRTYKG